MATTNVPMPTLGTAGFQPVANSDILNGVISDIQSAFGGTLNLSINNTASLTTPQGQLASSLAAIISDCFAQFLFYASQTDPQYAQGSMQDAIGNIYFMQRIPASSTTVSATVTGLPNTVIPANVAVAQDLNGNLYACQLPAGGGVTIPLSGSCAVTFVSMVPGPTAYPGTGMSIYQTTPGWDLISSPVQLALGANVETQQAFETRRQASVAANSLVSMGTVKGAVFTAIANSGVGTSVYVTENPSNLAVTFGGVVLAPNSIYVAVQAGALGIAPSIIANAIWMSKSVGCNYTPSVMFTATLSSNLLVVSAVASGFLLTGQTLIGGPFTAAMGITITGQTLGTTGGVGTYTISSAAYTIGVGTALTASQVVAVTDTSYSIPQPIYYVQYTTPQQVPIYVQVTLASSANPPNNALQIIQGAVSGTLGLQAALTGADGGPAAAIGGTVFGSRFYQTILAGIPTAEILSVLVNTSASFGSNPTSVPININQYPTLINASQITLVLA